MARFLELCMEKITGKNNDIIKNVKKLLSSTKHRREQGLFVLEGARLVFDVLNSFYTVSCLLITQNAYEKYKTQADEIAKHCQRVFIISDDISEKLSDTKNPQGVFAICRMRNNADFRFIPNGRYIALDHIQDPGNLGTIVRTAEALGIDGVIIGGGCDMYNPKVLRAAMGSMLRMHIVQTDDLAQMLTGLKSKGVPVYASTPDSNAAPVTDIDFSAGGVCVIGNEANGVREEIKRICGSLVTIKMTGRAESLNASAAASILMWEMLR